MFSCDKGTGGLSIIELYTRGTHAVREAAGSWQETPAPIFRAGSSFLPPTALLWCLGSHTLQLGPESQKSQLPLDLIQKSSLLSQTGSPLGDFWGCYGSKIDNSHLERQFGVAEDDQQHPSRPYPIGAGVNDHHSCSAVFFTSSCGFVLSLGPAQHVESE